MALSRFFAAVAACVIVASTPVLANEVQEINQQFRKGDLTGALDSANPIWPKTRRMHRRASSRA